MTQHHPLLKELLEICKSHHLEVARAYLTFEVYFELSEGRKLFELKHHFNERLRKFYLSGKKERSDQIPDVYVPFMLDDEITPAEINIIQYVLCPDTNWFYIVIKDRDSSSTCYCLKQGLAIPESPETCKRRKELEGKKYHFDKSIYSNRKFFYTKALENKDSYMKESDECSKSDGNMQ